MRNQPKRARTKVVVQTCSGWVTFTVNDETMIAVWRELERGTCFKSAKVTKNPHPGETE